MPVVVFQGWVRGTHPFCGPESGEAPWFKGQRLDVSDQHFATLQREYATVGPEHTPAFVIAAPEAPTESPIEGDPTPSKPAPTRRK